MEGKTNQEEQIESVSLPVYTNEEIDNLSAEELREYAKGSRANFEKGVQDLHATSRDVTQYAMESVKNPSSLVTLYQGNPELAKGVLKTAYKGISLDEFKKQHLSETNTQPDQQDVTQAVESALLKAKVDDYYNDVVSKLPEDVQEAFAKEYAELSQGREVDITKAKKYARLALKEVEESNKTNVNTSGLGLLGSGVSSGPKSDTDKKNDQITKNIEQLKSLGI